MPPLAAHPYRDTPERARLHRRALCRVERRAVVLCHRPAPHGAGPTSRVPEAPDPWAVEPGAHAHTPAIVECFTCRGGGRVRCFGCRGTGSLTCGECDGQGRRFTAIGWRPCTVCARRGRTECRSCTAGRRPCPTCDGHGRLRVHWEVRVGEIALLVTGDPKPNAACLPDPADFDAAGGRWPGMLCCDTGMQRGLLPPPGLLPDLDPVTDRVTAARVQTFVVDQRGGSSRREKTSSIRSRSSGRANT